MILQIISWYKFFVRRIDGLTEEGSHVRLIDLCITQL